MTHIDFMLVESKGVFFTIACLPIIHPLLVLLLHFLGHGIHSHSCHGRRPQVSLSRFGVSVETVATLLSFEDDCIFRGLNNEVSGLTGAFLPTLYFHSTKVGGQIAIVCHTIIPTNWASSFWLTLS